MFPSATDTINNTTNNATNGGLGSYWKGTDGNVWVYGDQGTNSAGAWNDSTKGYWDGMGYTQIVDPSPGQTLGATTSPNNTQQASGIDSEAAKAAQKEAEDAAKRASLKTGINKLIGDTLGIYEGLFGNVRTAATSQRQQLDSRFDRETGALTSQFNQELPKIGRAYAGRGAYDSSYRQGAEGQAQEGFQNQMTDLSEGRQADAAKIGQFQMEQEAEMTAGQTSLQRILADLEQTNDLNELTELKRSIEAKEAQLRASGASLQSRDAYVGKFNEIAPAAERLSGLQATLTNIVNGQAPGPLKRAIAQQIIGSAGLPKDQEQQLLSQINSQIA